MEFFWQIVLLAFMVWLGDREWNRWKAKHWLDKSKKPRQADFEAHKEAYNRKEQEKLIGRKRERDLIEDAMIEEILIEEVPDSVNSMAWERDRRTGRCELVKVDGKTVIK